MTCPATSRSFDQRPPASSCQKKSCRWWIGTRATVPSKLPVYKSLACRSDHQTTAASHSDNCHCCPSTLSLLGSSFKTCLPPATAHTGRNIPSLQFLRPSRACSPTGRNIPSYLRATKCTRGFLSQLPLATATAAPTRGCVSYSLVSHPGDGSADPETSALTSRVTPHLHHTCHQERAGQVPSEVCSQAKHLSLLPFHRACHCGSMTLSVAQSSYSC